MSEFDPWKPVVIMGNASEPAIPHQPNVFEQREIVDRGVAKFMTARKRLGGRALEESITDDDESHTGVLDDSWYTDHIIGRDLD